MKMTDGKFRLHYKNLGETAALTWFRGEESIFRIELDAIEIDGLMKALCSLRMGMEEPVTPALDENPRVEAVPMSGISIRNHGDNLCELMLRHPGYGWLSFLMNAKTRNDLGSGLLNGPPQKVE